MRTVVGLNIFKALLETIVAYWVSDVVKNGFIKQFQIENAKIFVGIDIIKKNTIEVNIAIVFLCLIRRARTSSTGKYFSFQTLIRCF